MMRLMSLLSCLAAIGIAVIGLYRPQPDYSGLAVLSAAFLSAAFGGKVMQKRIEMSGAQSETTSESKPVK